MALRKRRNARRPVLPGFFVQNDDRSVFGVFGGAASAGGLRIVARPREVHERRAPL